MPELIELPDKNLFYVFNVTLFENKHRIVKQLKEAYEPNVHGHRTWASSFLLMDYLQTHRVLRANSDVLELGCGWGAASIYCAKNGARNVSGLDIDENVFPYLDVQATLNGVRIKKMKRSYDKLTSLQLSKYNLLLGGDICFWKELTPMLENLFEKAFASGVKRVILADPGRQPFLELVERCARFAKVDLREWYVCDPEFYEGYILDIRKK